MDLVNDLVPDIGSLPKVRQKRAPKHDFKDGAGRVFAHRHDNGGGWVADTAYAAPTVEIKRYAQVYGSARVTGLCRLENHARVFERACLYDNVVVKDRAKICGTTSVRDTTSVSGDAYVSGCAALSGNTRVHGNVVVAGFVNLINTCCHNGSPARRQILDGRSFAIDSHIYEICALRNGASLVNTTLRNVLVSGRSNLINTTIHTQLHFAAHERLYSKAGAAEYALSTCVIHLRDARILGGRIILPPMVVGSDNVFIDCNITLQPDDVQPDLFLPPAIVYYVQVNANRVIDLFGMSATALENIRNNRAGWPNENAQTNVSPILNAGSQRRILRLEGVT
jgi:hypothetical protein